MIAGFPWRAEGLEIAGPSAKDRVKDLPMSGENCDGFHGSGHSPLAAGVDLHPEAGVNPAHFAETASEGSSREAGGS